MLIAEPGGRITLSNPRAEALFMAVRDLEDSRLWQPFTFKGQPYRHDQVALARALQIGEIVAGEELRLLNENGTWRMFSVNAAPMRGQHGQIIAAVATYEDITTYRQTEQALQQARDQLDRRE